MCVIYVLFSAELFSSDKLTLALFARGHMFSVGVLVLTVLPCRHEGLKSREKLIISCFKAVVND